MKKFNNEDEWAEAVLAYRKKYNISILILVVLTIIFGIIGFALLIQSNVTSNSGSAGSFVCLMFALICFLDILITRIYRKGMIRNFDDPRYTQDCNISKRESYHHEEDNYYIDSLDIDDDFKDLDDLGDESNIEDSLNKIYRVQHSIDINTCQQCGYANKEGEEYCKLCHAKLNKKI